MTRILLADDHAIMMTGVEAILRDSPFEVVAKATRGDAVLDLVATARPDVLVLDVRMPERSGIDILRVLRNRGDRRPVVLLTASLGNASLVEALFLGVNGIVTKQNAQEGLIACLHQVTGGGRWIDPALMDRALDATFAPAGGSQAGIDRLSSRETAIGRLVARGLRNKDIAGELGMTEGTVKVYLHRIYEKLGIGNRTELAMRMQSLSDDRDFR